MGWAGRANPASCEGKVCTEDRQAIPAARLRNFLNLFATRAEFETYLKGRRLSPFQVQRIEQHLPARLRFAVDGAGGALIHATTPK